MEAINGKREKHKSMDVDGGKLWILLRRGGVANAAMNSYQLSIIISYTTKMTYAETI